VNATACRSCSLSQRCSPVRISGIVLRSGRRTALSPTRTCASSSRKTSESSFSSSSSSSSREDRTLTVGRSSSTRSRQYPHPQSQLFSYCSPTPFRPQQSFSRYRSAEEERAEAAHSALRHPLGDHFTFLHIFQEWERCAFSNSWCEQNFINHRSMKTVKQIR
jgi:hypothetical protein